MSINEDQAGFLREERGVLRESVTNARVMIFSCSAYRSMCDALYDQFLSGASVILYRAGEGYAKKLLSAVPKLGLGREETIKTLQHIAYLSGWGNMKLRSLDQKTLECTVEKCAFVLRRKDISGTSCFFLSGVLGGAASALFEKKFAARELDCEATGSKCCRFQITVDA